MWSKWQCLIFLTLYFPQEAKDTKVIQVKIFNSYNGTGIAILTGSYRVFVVNNVDEPHTRKLAELPG